MSSCLGAEKITANDKVAKSATTNCTINSILQSSQIFHYNKWQTGSDGHAYSGDQRIKQMYANGIQDYFVELEKMPDGRTQFAGVKDCAAYLANASFVK